ncbi:MAG: efflux RND transporter periplasmic adaptor subunit [Planctomycetota bacterium]|nr:efflux RND transporter periplasmic adaptor subunit [Planctomycetota bacterium]
MSEPRTSIFPSALLLVAWGALLLTTAGCKEAAPAVAEQPVPKVTVTPVVAQETTDADEYTGRTEASAIVEVRARVFGYLKTVDFKDGDFVKEGQTLFTIEPDEYQAIYNQSVSRIKLTTAKNDLAKANLARRAKLLPSGAISREEYEEAVAAVKETEATIATAEADAARTAIDLKYTVITAPISGRIDRAYVSRGNLLTGGLADGTLLTKIVQEQPMYVYFDIDEDSLLRYIKMRPDRDRTAEPGSLRELDMKCYIQLSNEKDFPHVGTLDFASSEVNAKTGTARIRGVFPNTNRELASGMFVRVRVPIGKPYQALLIPERALVKDLNIPFVYVVDSNQIAARRDVKLGAQRGNMRIITSGLKAGEAVIVNGVQRVRPGQKVQATVMEPTLPKSSIEKVADELPPRETQTTPGAASPASADSTNPER